MPLHWPDYGQQFLPGALSFDREQMAITSQPSTAEKQSMRAPAPPARTDDTHSEIRFRYSDLKLIVQEGFTRFKSRLYDTIISVHVDLTPILV